MKILNLDTKKKDFSKLLQDRLNIRDDINHKAENFVRKVIADIKKNKDKSLMKYVSQYDSKNISNTKKLLVTKNEIKQAYKITSSDQVSNLKKAINRIRKFAKKQLHKSWSYKDKSSTLGEKVTAIDSVGVYVPGGKASYPSTVMMNVIPARVAGVRKIYMGCPIDDIKNHSLAIVAADLCKVDSIFKMGGAHSIAALAYGTPTIPKVDKIVGPGNLFVSTAKKFVFGDVGIDNIAGPSEIVIVADKKNNPDMIAIDLFSQAEHDELAQPILISKSHLLIESVFNSMKKLLPRMSRKKIIMESIKNRGLFIKTNDFVIDQNQNFVNDTTFFWVEEKENDKNGMLKFISNSYIVNPNTIIFDNNLNIHFESKTKDNGVGIYYFDDKKDDWIYLKTKYNNNKYSTSVLSNETFALIKDDKNPVITNLIPNINSTYRFQDLKILSFNIDDELSGISDIKNIQVKIDGENILFDYIPYRKLVQYTFDEELLEGEHTLEIIAKDNVGNTKKIKGSFEIK